VVLCRLFHGIVETKELLKWLIHNYLLFTLQARAL
jgi:hypothetical protein